MENLSTDSTCVKVHGSTNGGKTTDKAVDSTKGGLNKTPYNRKWSEKFGRIFAICRK